MTADERYRRYVSWMRLTHGGRRGREEMSPRDQAELESLGITQVSAPDTNEAKRLYEEYTAEL